MTRAAVTGAVDFTTARPDDRWWWHGLHWRCDQVESILLERLLLARHDVAASILGSPTSAEQAKAASEESEKIIASMIEHGLPYLKGLTDGHVKDARRSLADAWKARWGRLGEAKTEAAIDKTVQALRARRRGKSKAGRGGRP